MMRLENLTVRRDGRTVLGGIDLTVGMGEFVGLLGPNGAGKTTLLRAALGLLPSTGASSLAALPAAQRARMAAFLSQERTIAWPMSVEALVTLGRIAHPDAASDADRMAVERALQALSLGPLRHRPATHLSGGEQARVLIARALAQDTPLLLADEPIAGLDPAAQLGVMGLFRDLAADGRGILASLHDLGLAARFCSRLILLKDGCIHADGPPEAVLTPATLASVFGIRAHLSHGPEGVLFQALGIVTKED